MKVTFIATVLNEEKTIDRFLESIQNQSIKPNEVIITDGGSTDMTVEKTKIFQKNYSRQFTLIQKKGNRSIGRNAAIEKAKGDLILCSDAGCTLDRDWVKNISKPFSDKTVDVVAGYYKGIAKTIFQRCLIPYILVMPDKVNTKMFLPATRSMAFRKKVWNDIGKFDIKLSHNEDYAFAKKLQNQKKKIFFVKSAIVYWYPPSTWRKSFVMFYRFAKGDSEARIIRPKVLFLFLRYIILLFLLLFSFYNGYIIFFSILIIMLYIIWSISKNYKYVQNTQAFYLLPMLQFISDGAVITGTFEGFINQKY